MKIYVASSWANKYQPEVITTLRLAGHEVYDFRNPGANEVGFSWSQVDSGWTDWSVSQFTDGLRHPTARHAFERDFSALKWCELCVLVLPSGMSAHLEAGWCAGSERPVVVYAPEFHQAELMYGLFDVGEGVAIVQSLAALVLALGAPGSRGER